jgi:hypothetical protein
MFRIKALLLAVFLSLLACSAQAQIGTPTALGNGNINGSGSSLGITSITITAGDLVVVGIANYNGTNNATISTVSDGTNTYTLAKSQLGAGAGTVNIYYKANASAITGGTITVTMSGAIGAGDAVIGAVAQVSGVLTVSPYDSAGATGSQSSSTGAISLASGTLAQATEVAFGASFQEPSTATWTQTGSFTKLFSGGDAGNNAVLVFSYLVTASTSAVTFSGTWSQSTARFNGQEVTPFKGAAAAAACTRTLLGVGKC